MDQKQGGRERQLVRAVMMRAWRRVHRLRPEGEPRNERAEESSVRHLQELYTVAVALALTIGVERVLPAEYQGDVQLRVSLVFAAFVATLVPFYHGAQRHLDVTYVFPSRPVDKNALLFGDFIFLFVEACLLIAMGASVENPARFIAIWLSLLTLDVIWLLVFVQVSRRGERAAGQPSHAPTEHADQVPWQSYGWAVVNVPALVVGVVVLSELGSAGQEAVGPSLAVLALCIGRSALDYLWNWRTYFPEAGGVH